MRPGLACKGITGLVSDLSYFEAARLTAGEGFLYPAYLMEATQVCSANPFVGILGTVQNERCSRQMMLHAIQG